MIIVRLDIGTENKKNKPKIKSLNVLMIYKI